MTEGGFPTDGMELTRILVVSDRGQSLPFYRDVLGATVNREYGGTLGVLSFLNNRLLLVTGDEPTPDKLTVTFSPPTNPDDVSAVFTIRVPDCKAAYDVLKSRGAASLTPPMSSQWETRAFFRDPDGHLFEISQSA